MGKRKRKQKWHSIDKIHMFKKMASDEIASAKKVLSNLIRLKNVPYIFDEKIVGRSLRIYNDQMECVECYERQISKWEKEPLSDEQKNEVESLAVQTRQYRELTEKTMLMFKEIKKKISEMDEVESELGTLLRNIKLPLPKS